MRCPLCDHLMSKAQCDQVGICEACEIDYHGCSTGDCPHWYQVQCDDTLRDLKAEQKIRAAIPLADQTE